MALELNKLLSSGIQADECYVRICQVGFDRLITTVRIEYYFNKLARDQNYNSIERKEIRFKVEEDKKKVKPECDERKWMYKKIKKLKEFKNAKNI